MALLKADAERREPQHRNPLVVRLDGALGRWHLATTRCREWKQVTFVLEIMPVVGSLWSAATALFGDGSKAGKRWVWQKLTAMLCGRVGYVIGGLRQNPHQAAAAEVGPGDAGHSHHVPPQPPALDAV